MKRMEDVDVFLFTDIDCISLSKDSIARGVEKATQGILFGAEGAPNHIKPLRSYAGAWYVYISRKYWHAYSRPSARPTPHTDVCQAWMDTWNVYKAPVELIAPTSCLEPRWDLPGRPRGYGLATTYGNGCFHLFEAHAGNQRHFIERCRQITG